MDGFERLGEPGGIRWLAATGLGSIGVLAAFTERTGGVSAAPYASLNLASHVGDDPAAVEDNRRETINALGLPGIAVAEQVHGAAIHRVDSAPAGHAAELVARCDALLTDAPGTALAILTADCAPVALSDGTRTLAVHVGWRGAAAGIVTEAVRAFSGAGRVRAAIGPSIRDCHYEVGGDVLAAVGAGLGIVPVSRRAAGSAYLDLPTSISRALRALGVDDVAETGLCTACEPERFYSHRRDGPTGRQAMVVVRG